MLNKPKMHTFFSRLKKERMVKRRERRKTQNRKKKEKLFYLFLFLHNEELVLDGWICWSIRFFSLYIYPFFLYLFILSSRKYSYNPFPFYYVRKKFCLFSSASPEINSLTRTHRLYCNQKKKKRPKPTTISITFFFGNISKVS